MKKYSILLATLLSLTALAACEKKADEAPASAPAPTAAAPADAAKPADAAAPAAPAATEPAAAMPAPEKK